MIAVTAITISIAIITIVTMMAVRAPSDTVKFDPSDSFIPPLTTTYVRLSSTEAWTTVVESVLAPTINVYN